MRHLLPALLAAGLAGCASGDRLPLQSWGYVAWWLLPGAEDIRASRFDRLLFFEIEIAADGSVRDPHGWPDPPGLHAVARELGTPVDVTLTLRGRADFDALFASPASVERLMAVCRTLLADPRVAGLQLDIEHYEPSSPAALAGLRGFVPALAEAMHAHKPRKVLSVFVPINADPLYDAASLEQVDWVVMQSYDAHWIDSPNAGPVAPLAGRDALTWESVLALADGLGVPRARTLMAFPLYGYEWPVETGEPRGRTTGPASITTLAPVGAGSLPRIANSVQERVALHGCRRDLPTASMHYLLRHPERGWLAGWYENEWSLRLKRNFLVEHRLGGVAFFLVGYDGQRLTRIFDKRRSPDDMGTPSPDGPC